MANTNRNTSNLSFDLNEEGSHLEDEVQNPSTTLVKYFDSTWSEEEEHHIQISEELQCNIDGQEFLADDI